MALSPDREAFRTLARQGNLVPVWEELLADEQTPVGAYARLRDRLRADHGVSHTFLLESVEGGEQIGRYSFIGGQPRAIFRAWDRRVEIERRGRTETLEDTDPLDALRRLLGDYRPVRNPPLPRFTGGAVGFMGYECVARFEPVPVREDQAIPAPDMVFLVTDTLVVFDRVRHTVLLIANALVADGDADAAYDRARTRIAALRETLSAPRPARMIALGGPQPLPSTPHSTMTRAQFVDAVERAREYIRAGDVIQVVLSQRFDVPFAGDALDVYRALRSVNPSPYMFCLDLGGSALVGSSPEVHVRCEDRAVAVRPIAGTRPRADDPARDAALERELLADPKERAEHLMLVDLARNDIGRVCEYGSVTVPEFMVIERYSHVMHIVSEVTGRLREDLDVFDLMRATFPAGTVSGAPKIRAMQLIAELETARRGPYSGVVGYFGFDGGLDCCITIRTAVLDQGRALVQAGAGIVADSDPDREYEETCSKARGLLAAIERARHVVRSNEEAGT